MVTSIPKVGSCIYVPTIENYFVGGLAKVSHVVGEENNHHIVVEEHEGANYAWERRLELMQDELREKFGNGQAYSTGVPLTCPLKKN